MNSYFIFGRIIIGLDSIGHSNIEQKLWDISLQLIKSDVFSDAEMIRFLSFKIKN